MFNLVPMLANVIQSLVVSKAQDLAEEHVMSAINEHLPEDAQKVLDEAIKSAPETGAATDLKSLLKL
jgi:uncharacterized BrkB/YihY/UPF0761 family membrane protein